MNMNQKKFVLLPIAAAVFMAASIYSSSHNNEIVKAQETVPANTPYETAIFAGGCFWQMEAVFQPLDGVVDVENGYTGGHTENPTYEEVGSQTTGHLESVKVRYNPSQITYANLLDVFWQNVDPTDTEGQFIDRGNEYQSEIFYSNEEQKALAEASKEAMVSSKRFEQPIVTKIEPNATFYKAEEEHQDFYKKNPLSFKLNRLSSGRDSFRAKYWGIGG